MNALAASECSSGCESGWTIYLNNSFLNHNPSPFIGAQDDDDDNGFYDEEDKYIKSKSEEDQEEDWSMVSDASSGPPHFPQHDESYNNFNAQQDINPGCFYSASKAASKRRSKKKKKVKENQHLQDKQLQQQQQHLPSFLDDTASSPLFDFSMNSISVSNQQISIESMVDYSQGFSATYFEVLAFFSLLFIIEDFTLGSKSYVTWFICAVSGKILIARPLWFSATISIRK
ncbi:PREDICTED: uncharacterized protein LOC109350085 isoform X1 [Lupinus angustifolius]|uniref:uncharacterized protein LOC109338544 isoform X1 n=1 Tax=Lupinus angustifolius TaxID=3871 RepID=UPI00092E60F3|nr:PREDICTED: uncharacterized protein LOC109338544 isoform X1 [Lupinus angustifolius]XP_019431354.1 PREDICTED: uncharacterized protein LOC109338544 isoform X1 [Lupinus angustifolius]XP_019431356.1 PREDICTED: uncharacterized protein LOC109338545 isoform X1 [Lupinus angustifolius]XP_019431357.1 PREDICTED: uncharacterized protein LOC109338545 isoform X1 [Lupinus angustifolius]XP_019446758.1 PREDICTED: uncharacterized protein LOC109350085 isoform X1 [Lupinus angustifolius]XP_019446759.1 PREDICTED: